MANIDTLDIQFNADASTAVANIRDMANAVSNLANTLSSIDGSNLKAFSTSMTVIKGTIPTSDEVARMTLFAGAVTQLSETAGVSNLASMGEAMASMGQQAQEAFAKVEKAKANMDTWMTNSAVKIFKLDDIIPPLDTVASRVDRIKAVFRGLAIPTKPFKNLEEKADKIAKKYEDLRQKMIEALGNGEDIKSPAFRQMEAELDALRQKYDDLILKQKELALAGGAIQLNPTVKGSLDAFAQGFTKVTDIVKNTFSAAMKKATGLVKSFGSSIKSAAKSAKDLVTGGNSATDMAKKFAKELVRVTKMLKLMVTRMALRAVIKEVGNGFKSLALHSEQFDKTMSDVINASKRLGYSFSAMIAPLINALAPAIIYIIDLLTKLINVINQVFSALSGASTWNKAIKFTDKWSDSIRDAGKSGSKAAKELKKTVLGFDELNQLQDNKNSGGGGGSDIKDMFETVDIDPKWKEFADWLKDMWKMGDFTDLGKFLGEQLRDFLRAIPWEEFKATARKLGESLATLINGFVEVEGLGWEIGNAIAQSLNTIFEFVNAFVHRLHWDSIGKFIAETFNGFFENIDWALIKDTVVTGMAGLAEAIQNFIDTFHWDNISNFIINGVDTIVSGVKAFFEGIDWSDLGHKIGDQITKTLKGTDWKSVGEAIGDILQAAIDFVAGIINELDVDDVVKALGDMWEGITARVDAEEAGANIGKILQSLLDIIKGFWSAHGSEVVEELKKFFKGIWDNLNHADILRGLLIILNLAVINGVLHLTGFLAKELAKAGIRKIVADGIFGAGGKGLISTITKNLASAGKAITSWIGSLATNISSALSTATTAISSWLTADVGATVASGGAAAGGMIASSIVGGIAAFLGGAEIGKKLGEWLFPDDADLYDHYSGIKGTFELVKDTAVTLTERTGEHVSNAWDNVKEATKTFAERTSEHFDNFKENASTALDNVKEAAKTFVERTDEHWGNATTALANFANNVGTNLNNVKTQFAELKDTAVDKLGGFASAVKEKFEAAKNFIKTVDWGRVIDEIKSSMSSLKENATTNLGAFSTTVKEKFEAAKTFIKDVNWGAVIDEVKNTFSDLVSDAGTKLTEFKETLTTKFDEAKKTFEDFKDKLAEAFSVDNWTFEGVAEGLKKTFEGAKTAIKGVWNNIAEKLNGSHEVGSSNFKIDLPKLYATGGFPEDGLFFANHNELVGQFSNGKTAVANNAQIVAGIESGVYKAVSQAMANNSGGSSYISNEILIDGEVIARSITKAQEKQNRRYSPQTV